MVKKFFLILTIFLTAQLLSCSAANAYEDCIISSDGKLTDIKIKDESIIKILPIVTIMNEKNMYRIEPLKEGKTQVCVLKNDKDIIDFEVRVKPDETIVSEAEGIEFLTLDEPEEAVELDMPPLLKEGGENG